MAKYCPMYNCKVLYLDCLECEEKICRKDKNVKLSKGDVIKLTNKSSEKVFLFCGKIKVPGGNDKLVYDLKKHKEVGFDFKNYCRIDELYIRIHDVKIIKNVGIEKAEEYKNKFEEYFKKL